MDVKRSAMQKKKHFDLHCISNHSTLQTKQLFQLYDIFSLVISASIYLLHITRENQLAKSNVLKANIDSQSKTSQPTVVY